ncbi:MAG: hypothetical protein KHX46_00840 [Clostridiales bacterium]|nr:hypothetical protein [Clostridiales bacterium]
MNQLCVISHTHWDREWYFPLELMRLRLVDLLDHCCALLAEEPTYVFHLDAQTIVLEDYLSIRPEMRGELEKYVRQGRLIVGPWYLQNDFYLTSGEATVRNLLEGRRVAQRFGRCANVGYCADQFGLISQLPQILRGFGIDNCIFGRGAARLRQDENGNPVRVPFPMEFIWKGGDGSEVTAIHMCCWYNNAQRFSADIDRAERLTRQIGETLSARASTPYLLLMNGVDHLEAQEDLLPILHQVNERLGEDGHIFQTTMEQYVRSVTDYAAEQGIAFDRHTGELRCGGDWELLKGTLSSRIYLKQSNVHMQEKLESVLEPLYTMLECAGMAGAYSLDHFRYMWRELMKNHPHDSICGCSRDEVHAHMEDNFARLEEMSEEMLRRGLELAGTHLQVPGVCKEDYGILAVNTLQRARGAVLYVTLDFPQQEAVEGFTIADAEGRAVPFAVLAKRTAVRDLFSPINLPGSLDVDRYDVAVYAQELPPMSMTPFVVRRAAEPAELIQPRVLAEPTIENEFLRVMVGGQGQVELVDKETGRRITDAFMWEHSMDIGDSYVYFPSTCPPVLGREFPVEIQATAPDPFTQCVRLKQTLVLPAGYDFAAGCCRKETVECPVSLTLTLRTGDPMLRVGYTVDNRAQEHRLRLRVGTGLSSGDTLADTPYDLLRRSENDHYPDTRSRVYPNTSAVAQETEGRGTAIFTSGQHEYELLRGEMGDAIALTVVRSTGVINRDVWNGKPCGDQWVCPQNQCLRVLEGEVGLLLYTGSRAEQLTVLAKMFRNAPAVQFYSHDPHKFVGGRPAVQDTSIAELFYRPDPYPQALIRPGKEFLALEGKGVCLSAFKKAEDGDGWIIRLWDAGEPTQAVIRAKGRIYASDLAEIPGEYLGEDQVRVPLERREIVTLRLRPDK